MKGEHQSKFSAAAVNAGERKTIAPKRYYDADGEALGLPEREDFKAYAKAVCELLERQGPAMGTRDIHEALGYEHRGWTLDALEALVLKVERIDGGTMTRWVRKDLEQLRTMSRQERNDFSYQMAQKTPPKADLGL